MWKQEVQAWRLGSGSSLVVGYQTGKHGGVSRLGRGVNKLSL